MFALAQHRLTATDGGPVVRSEDSPNVSVPGIIQPRFLVFHYTACSHDAARASFMDKHAANPVSAHLLVDTDGSVTQFVPFNRRAWHAGVSFWAGLADINTYSIGIEVVNYGYLQKRADGSFVTADGKSSVPSAQVVEARHKNPQDHHLYWQAYTAEQLETCARLAALLTASYGLVDVVGHEDIAPSRKLDPGPAFPLSRMSAALQARDAELADHPALFVGAALLNIRTGPGTQYPTAGPALTQGTRVSVLQQSPDGWSQVEVARVPPLTGWVRAAYLSLNPV